MEKEKSEELLDFFEDTSKILSDIAVSMNSNIVANNYTENVEFWQWIEKNFHNMDLNSSKAIADEVLGNEGFQTQIFGKMYEWDWVNKERLKLSNIDNIFDLPDDPSYQGVDVVKKSLFGGTDEYQLKSYTNGRPDLTNTPKTATVITNSENLSYAEDKGYNSKKFMDKEEILGRRSDIIEDIEDGDATPNYEFTDVAGTMLSAGIFGFVVGAGMETLNSYHKYKSGIISKKDYIKQVLKSGAERTLTASATTGIMIPVSAMLTDIGASTLFTVPIAFLVYNTIAKPIEAAFGHGEYGRVLSEAKIYNDTAEMAKEFSKASLNYQNEFIDFVKRSEKADREFLKISDEFNSEIAKLNEKIGYVEMSNNDEILLVSEEDIHNIEQLNDKDFQTAVNQIFFVANRTSHNYEFFKNSKWYQRMLYSISGKMHRTIMEIASDQAIMSKYCMQLMNKLWKHNKITQIAENKINKIYIQYLRLVKTTDQAYDAADEYSTFTMGLLTGYYTDDLVSAIRISENGFLLHLSPEKSEITFNAIRKNINSKKRKLSEWLSEINDFDEDEFKIYNDFSNKFDGIFAEIIKLCLALKYEDCLDLTGIEEVLKRFRIPNDLETLDTLVLKIISAK